MAWLNTIEFMQKFAKSFLLPLVSILAALAVGALILIIAGYDVTIAYGALLKGIFGNTRNIGEAFLKSTPLILIGTGIAVAFRCGIWNIGAEGQFYLGAIGATIVGLHMEHVSSLIAIPLGLVAGFLGGGVWGGVAGWLKVRFKANEVVTTIMLNYIAIGLVSYLVTGPMQEAMHANPQTDEIAVSMILPKIFPPTRVNLGYIFAILFAIAITFLLFRMPLGLSLRAVGFNQEASRHAGIGVENHFLIAMLISGGAAGLAGAIEVMGITGRLYANISSGYGFTGIAVSLLCGNHPLGTIITGWLFGALSSGSQLMQLTAQIPAVVISIIQGLVIIFLISFNVFGKRFRREP